MATAVSFGRNLTLGPRKSGGSCFLRSSILIHCLSIGDRLLANYFLKMPASDWLYTIKRQHFQTVISCVDLRSQLIGFSRGTFHLDYFYSPLFEKSLYFSVPRVANRTWHGDLPAATAHLRLYQLQLYEEENISTGIKFYEN